MKLPTILALGFLILLCTSCKKESIDDTPTNESNTLSLPSSFLVSPLEIKEIRFITPLGNLNPPGHTVPTDHIYFYFTNPDSCPCDLARLRTVVAPAGGIVQYIINSSDDKISIGVNSKFSYYLGHVKVLSTIKQGTDVAAGQVIGTTSGLSYALDLGVSNGNLTLTGFVNPSRYYDDMLHADAGLRFYEEPLRSQLYSYVRRVGNDKNGKIDFDQPGKLVGNWFLQGLSNESSMNPEGWPKQLAFVYDMYTPTQVRISIGGTLSMIGVYGIRTTDPDPGTISIANGVVQLGLTGFDGRFVAGTMVVQMITPDQIKVETFQNVSPPAAFTSNAKTYTR
jgi:hypothetical protein